ncbi:aryl-sulfate sulfotransferase [candidate division CSSED10-310 bacterium]|uniref:Aryl-sulfate sulfotransferase n=1 Tax=candidate division CSSED10-310 bacterium TaxID=2855610 RepID=A0ABV6YTA4_UNCC1
MKRYRTIGLIFLLLLISTSVTVFSWEPGPADPAPVSGDRDSDYPVHTRPVVIPAASEAVFEGFNLFSPMNSTDTYLLDNDGDVVYTWASSYTPGLSVYLLENGLLLRTGQLDNAYFSDTAGSGGKIQKIAPDGAVAWEYEYSGSLYLQHHDVECLPNGNVLLIAWEKKTQSEAIAAGRDPDLIPNGGLWPDHIIEVQPTGPSGGTIVWEWHVWDHLIQDFDAAKPNYGVVSDHPELIDLNFPTIARKSDWMHTNSIIYNTELDQIMISVRKFSEIWIIDHSTTSAQAASHSGGNSGRGGDLLYRWGNPLAYGAGTDTDQKLYRQHDARWIPNGYPGAGNILIFNNGNNRPGGEYSSVDEIIPPVNGYTYALIPDSAYGPDTQTWIYTAGTPTNFFAESISGAHRLPNGNTLICNGPVGSFFEVDYTTKATEWSYSHGTAVFRVTRYAPDYPGLPGNSPVPAMSCWALGIMIFLISGLLVIRPRFRSVAK